LRPSKVLEIAMKSNINLFNALYIYLEKQVLKLVKVELVF